MAKNRRPQPEPPASSRTTILILAIGGLVVAGLVAWALTRTVETPAIPTAADTSGGIATPAANPAPAPASNMPLTATQTPAPFAQPNAPQESTASVPRISVEDLREKVNAQAVTVIDVRDDAAFAAGHIPGALHIPFARVEGEMASLPKGKPVVTYCT